MKILLQTSLIALTLLFSACHKDPIGPKGGGPGNNDCNISGTITRIPCGTGIWDELWIKLDDGSLLEPCEINADISFQAREGQRVKFAYTKVDPAHACNSGQIHCMAATPEAEKVNINCITEETTTRDCELKGTIVRDNCAAGIWGDLVIRMDDGRLVIPFQSNVADFHPKEGLRVDFSYETDPLFCGDSYLCETFAPIDMVDGIITCIKSDGDNQQGDCNTLGTVKDYSHLDGCGLIIITDDGKKLNPVGTHLMDLDLNDGDRVKFDYRRSMAFTACMVGDAVYLNCIEKLDGPNNNPCKTLNTYKGINPPGYQHASINNARLEGSKLYLDIAFSGCSDQNRDFQLYWDGSLTKSFPSQATLKFRDLARPEMCQAYFMKTICFDVSALNMTVQPGPNPIEFTIDGTNFAFRL